jgi:hypothetical protein
VLDGRRNRDEVSGIALHRPGGPALFGFQEGESPEKLAQEFPAATLAQVYGASAYYLEHKKPLDDFFAEVKREFFSTVRPLSETNPELDARLEAVRQQLGSKRT